MTVRVKICGLTRKADVEAAVEAGADYLGFVLSESPRRVAPDTVLRFARINGGRAEMVGVYVDEPLEYVNRTAAQCGLDVIQLQGGETPEFCRRCERPVFKAVHMKRAGQEAHGYDVAALLFDTHVPGQAGGTGCRFDWRWLRGRRIDRPFFLAGGLTPENVHAAIATTHPDGVDVSSGVASSARCKDAGRIRAFVEAAKSN